MEHIALRGREMDRPVSATGAGIVDKGLGRNERRQSRDEFEEDLNGDRILAGNWNLVTRWNEESRYELHRADAEKLAEDMLLAISDAEQES
jgi:hypothetical protein